MKEIVSVNLLIGSYFAKLTADSTANDGKITVDHAERFTIDQKVVVEDDDASPAVGYVSTIDINTREIILVTTRGGATVVDFSANNMTTAKDAKCYYEGAKDNAFSNLREQLLSLANGGTANLFGQSKLAYPYLQAVQADGSGVTSTNVLDKIFDGWQETLQRGRGKATDVILSYKHMGNVMKQLENIASPYRHVETKVSAYGYEEITIQGVKGLLKLVAVQEMDDDFMIYMDWRALKLYSNGYFRKHYDPEGKQYYTIRETTGYVYLCDICFFGELALVSPWRCGIMHSIP